MGPDPIELGQGRRPVAGHVGLWLRRRAKLERGIRVGTASMLALLGVQLMLPERR
jgi:hypothetical protein